ncbi:Steroid 5 alpha-reductase 3 [Dipsacomyces acuminosporus]|nr:Steroid 5 alpha-reductase 3 [Dipsacomyces acuminosporus]
MLMLLSYLLRSIYVLLSAIALGFEVAPWTREAFVKYGKTRSTAPNNAQGKGKGGAQANARASEQSAVAKALAWFAQLTIPKYLFVQFYSLGVIVSALLTVDIIGWNKYQTSTQLAGSTPTFYLQNYMALEGHVLGHARDHFVAFPHSLAILALGMYNIHIIVRLKETVYDQPATKAQMHIGQYGVGVLFYIITPFAVIADSLYSPGWSSGSAWLVLLGIALFVYGSMRQWRCHHILFKLRYESLREESERREAEENSKPENADSSQPTAELPTYKIPTGDLFNYVSCPHYLCEIVIYIAMWFVTSCQSTTLLYVIGWEIVNLGITAKESQQWYRQTFGDKYPRSRRALVPFIW